VKRVAGLRDLSDDHHAGLVLARRCKQVARRPDADVAAFRRELRAAFARELAPHFEIEEEALLPALEAIGEPALAQRIRDEHRALRALEASDAPSLEQLGTLLEAHIRFEEREVFEPTQHRLPASALDAIQRARAARPRS
jgi:hypothetical protein